MKMKALKYDLCVQFVKRINFYFEHYFTSIMQWINSKYLNLTLKKSSTKWYQNVYTYTQVSLECTFLAMYFQWGLYFFPILFTVLYMTMYKKQKKIQLVVFCCHLPVRAPTVTGMAFHIATSQETGFVRTVITCANLCICVHMANRLDAY